MIYKIILRMSLSLESCEHNVGERTRTNIMAAALDVNSQHVIQNLEERFADDYKYLNWKTQAFI
jgi:hypothetical protein